MKITLIFAKADLRRGTRIKHFMTPPHSLQIIAALTPNRHEVTLVDEYHHEANLRLKADLVGISVWTASAQRAYRLADHYRQRGIPVVLGGPHVSICSDEASGHADAIVVGEAESVWEDLLRDVEKGQLQSRYVGIPQPLDLSPAPDWSVVRKNDYALGLSLSTTRGCTRRCDFCLESSRPKPNFRRRDLPLVLAEMDARPCPVIAFLDNDIAADRPYCRQLFNALIPRKRRWLGMTSIETANDEAMLDLMAASGCRSLFVGFESISPDSLREVHKRCNLVDLYRRNIQRIHDRGIMINGSFVFGFDHDGPDIFKRTAEFGIEARLDTATFTVLTPYPGTTLYRRLLEEGRITDHDWAHYDTTHVVYRPMGMSPQELESGYFNAYKMFYSWAAIVKRCRPAESGFAKRVFLNVAYKRLEPLYRYLGNPLPIGWLRPIFHWYSRPFSHQSVYARHEVGAAPEATGRSLQGANQESHPPLTERRNESGGTLRGSHRMCS